MKESYFDIRQVGFVLTQFALGRLDEIDNPNRPAIGTRNCVMTAGGLRPLTLVEYATDCGVIDVFERILVSHRIQSIALILCHFFGVTSHELALVMGLANAYAGTDLLIESQQLFAEKLYELD